MEDILPILIGGLILFLFAISQLSEVLKNTFSEKAKTLIKKGTSNIFYSILIGIILTIILDSSSAVIILVIIFINSEALTFKQAIGIVMGSNIGTTISSQIIALDIGRYSIIPLSLGFIVQVFSKNRKYKRVGRVLLYFGMLFFGLFLMENSVLPLKDSELFKQWTQRIDENYIQGALIGGLITLIIQSSSGTVGIAIILGKQKILTLAGGIAIMLGAELGTCSDTLLATIKGTRQAIKTGLFHVFFNFSTIVIGLLFFTPFLTIVKRISFNQNIGNQIANAHVLFNILGVILFLPFVGFVEKSLNKILPDKKILITKNL